MRYHDYYQSDLHCRNVSLELFTNCEDTIKMWFVGMIKTGGKRGGKLKEKFPFSPI